VTGPDRETLAVYAARATDYSEIHHGDVAQSVLTAFIGALAPGGPLKRFDWVYAHDVAARHPLTAAPMP